MTRIDGEHLDLTKPTCTVTHDGCDEPDRLIVVHGDQDVRVRVANGLSHRLGLVRTPVVAMQTPIEFWADHADR